MSCRNVRTQVSPKEMGRLVADLCVRGPGGIRMLPSKEVLFERLRADCQRRWLKSIITTFPGGYEAFAREAGLLVEGMERRCQVAVVPQIRHSADVAASSSGNVTASEGPRRDPSQSRRRRADKYAMLQRFRGRGKSRRIPSVVARNYASGSHKSPTVRYVPGLFKLRLPSFSGMGIPVQFSDANYSLAKRDHCVPSIVRRQGSFGSVSQPCRSGASSWF